MANITGSSVKFYSSKTYAEAVALAASEPGSIFFTDKGIVVNGEIWANVSSGSGTGTASEIVTTLGTTPVNRATSDKDGNQIDTTYAKLNATSNKFTGTVYIGNLEIDDNKVVTRGDIAGIVGVMHFKGVADTAGDTTFSDGMVTTSVTVAGSTFIATAGDLVIQGGVEFVFSGTKWAKLGDESLYVVKTTALNSTDTDKGVAVTLGGTAATPTIDVAVTAGSVASGNTSVVTGGAVHTAITTAVEALDVTVTGPTAAKTLASLYETDGKIGATFQDIAIAESQVTNLTTDLAAKQDTLVDTTGYGKRVKDLETKTAAITNYDSSYKIEKGSAKITLASSAATISSTASGAATVKIGTLTTSGGVTYEGVETTDGYVFVGDFATSDGVFILSSGGQPDDADNPNDNTADILIGSSSVKESMQKTATMYANLTWE